VCNDNGGTKPDGDSCGQNMVCNNGTCTSCTANVTCVAGTCRVGKTSCASGTSECVLTGDAPDNTECGQNAICKGGDCLNCGSAGLPCCNGACLGGGTCSNGRCCPAGQTWTGSNCEVVCGSNSYVCNGACVANTVPCNGGCPPGRINCSGTCRVGDCCTNSQCGFCKKCSNYACVNQSASEDLNNDCYEGPCDTGNCNGSGACAHLAANTRYCEVTRIITCSGGEGYTDFQCPNWCTGCKPGPGCTKSSYCNDCTPNFKECVGSGSRTCSADGRWGPVSPCANGCQNGSCN
jgi:hypothetical protein